MGAASVVTVTTIASIIGRVTFIGIGDRLPPEMWTIVASAAPAIAFGSLVASSAEPSPLVIGSPLFWQTVDVAVTLLPCDGLRLWP